MKLLTSLALLAAVCTAAHRERRGFVTHGTTNEATSYQNVNLQSHGSVPFPVESSHVGTFPGGLDGLGGHGGALLGASHAVLPLLDDGLEGHGAGYGALGGHY